MENKLSISGNYAEKYKNLISACIRRADFFHKIKELKVHAEHVLCVVEISLTMSPTQALQILKWVSARLFFKFHEKAKLRYPRGNLLSPGNFVSSLGFVQLEIGERYVRNQEKHHSLSR